MTTKYQYGKMTWPEIKEAAAQKRVALLPTGCIEDHGPHLPLDVDVLLPTTICERAAEIVPGPVRRGAGGRPRLRSAPPGLSPA